MVKRKKIVETVKTVTCQSKYGTHDKYILTIHIDTENILLTMVCEIFAAGWAGEKQVSKSENL